MRKPIVAGNWKMNMNTREAESLVSGLKQELKEVSEVDVVVCPPFTALQSVGEALSDTTIGLGAQNMHHEKSGAFTGEISPLMLRDLHCRYVILGHSERRTLFHETDAQINAKVKAALEGSFKPIICVGETLEQRENGVTNEVVAEQIKGCFEGLSAMEAKACIVAYEPVWAIGTGKTASPEQAQEVHAFIRGLLAELFDHATADSIRIQYGGSVKPNNAKEIFSKPDIDGGLIGGASLEVRSFVDIVIAAR